MNDIDFAILLGIVFFSVFGMTIELCIWLDMRKKRKQQLEIEKLYGNRSSRHDDLPRGPRAGR